MEATFVLIRPVSAAAEGVVRQPKAPLNLISDQKSLDHYEALVKRTQIHRRLHIQHLAYHRRPQWNCLK